MVPGQRLQSVLAADVRVGLAHVRRYSRRHAGALQDFLIDPADRLTEQERALMGGMLHSLVARIAEDMRARLPSGLAKASACNPSDLVSQLGRHGLLERSELIALLLRRTDARRISEGAAAISAEPAAEALLKRWTEDEVQPVAAAASNVVIGRAAARNRFGQLGLELADCSAEIAVPLAYAVAAALAQRCGPGADEELVAAAVDLLARHDEGQCLDALEARLVLALDQAGRLDSATLQALANSGEICLLSEALARLARIPGHHAWALLADPRDGRLALLLRMAGQPRALVANLFARLAVPLGLRDPASEIEWFDRIRDEEAAEARSRCRLPPAYQSAAAALDEHGHFLA